MQISKIGDFASTKLLCWFRAFDLQMVKIFEKSGIRAFDRVIHQNLTNEIGLFCYPEFDLVLVSRVVCIIQIVTLWQLRALKRVASTRQTRVNLTYGNNYLIYFFVLIIVSLTRINVFKLIKIIFNLF